MTRIRKRYRRLGELKDCESGVSLVEAALVLPVLIPLMFGLYDFARAFETLATARKSIQTASRYLATLPKSGVCGWGLTRARNLAVYGNIAGSGPVLSSIQNIQLALPTTSTCTNTSISSIPKIELTADVPFSPLILSAFGNTWTFTINREERWIGQ